MRVEARWRSRQGTYAREWGAWHEVSTLHLAPWVLQGLAFLGSSGRISAKNAHTHHQWRIAK